jgi:hypothetical protein
MLTEMNAKMDGKQEEMLARMPEDIKSGQAEMRSTIRTFGSELKETIQREIRTVIQPRRAELDETSTCREATETEPHPGMMQSIEEHQETPKENAVVMPVGEPRKRRRIWHLASKRRQKRKEGTRGNCKSKRKSAAACRKVSSSAKMAWRKSNLFRKIRILEKCGRRKEFAAARIRTTRCAKVARRKRRSYEGPSVEQGRRKNKTEEGCSEGDN